MKIKELQEVRNSIVKEMKALTEVEDKFDKEKFNAKEIELSEIEDKIKSLEKVQELTEVENKIEKVEKEGNTMEFKNAILEGKEKTIDFKNAMTTTNVKMEKVGNGAAVIEKAQENEILQHLRMIPVTGTSEVPVQKQKLGKLVKAAELTELAKKDVLFDKVSLRPEKYATIVPVSEELFENAAYDVESIITEECRQAVNDKIAELVVKGDDTSFGLEKALKANGAKEVTRTTSNALCLDDINGLYFGLDAKFRKSGVWVMNDKDLQLLVTLTDSTGRPIIHQDLARGFNFVLYGRPIIVSNDATKMYFADLAQAMVIGAGNTAQIKKSTEAMFDVAGIAFRVMSYIDVKPALQKAIAYMA